MKIPKMAIYNEAAIRRLPSWRLFLKEKNESYIEAAKYQ